MGHPFLFAPENQQNTLATADTLIIELIILKKFCCPFSAARTSRGGRKRALRYGTANNLHRNVIQSACL